MESNNQASHKSDVVTTAKGILPTLVTCDTEDIPYPVYTRIKGNHLMILTKVEIPLFEGVNLRD